MKPNVVFSVFVVCTGSACFAQNEAGLKKTQRAPVATNSMPVTEAEAVATFERVAGLYKSVLHITVPPMREKAKPSAPVTRSEVVAEFVRLYKAAEPSFTFTPRKVIVDLARLVIDTPSERIGLVMMIDRGCVGNYGPLATGKKSTLSVQDFGDSIGFFLSRISECTHVPSSKWTPFLHE